MSGTLTIRDLDDDALRRLHAAAERRGVSLEDFVCSLLERDAQAFDSADSSTKDDLMSLAGGWSDEDADAFLKATECFERIEPDMWK